MTSATVPPVFPVMSLTIESWQDPVIDELGHDPRSAYVEKFWLPVLGPSTIWFLRRLEAKVGVPTDRGCSDEEHAAQRGEIPVNFRG